MNCRKVVCLSLIFSVLLISSFSVIAEPTEAVLAGEKLFKTSCASCHKVDKKLIGPALQGVEQRWIDAGDFDGKAGREWLNIWIRNSSEAIKAGYPYAVEMSKFDAQVMTAFPQLTDADIANILTYVENVPPPPSPPGGEVAAPSGSGENTQLFLYGLVIVLVLVILFLGKLLSNLNKMVLEKQGLPIPIPVPFYKDKKFAVTIGLLLVIYIGYAAVNEAINLGRQQGYMPEQPIKFSHKLHAGIDKIDCQYCHSSAAKSKTSGIPSVNVCMNCHKGIQEGAINGKYGRREITKIYAAAGFDPNTLSYHKLDDDSAAMKLYAEWLKGDEKHKYTQEDIDEVTSFVNKPVEWVRIHNLPDHVYFNHSQHVTVAGLQCQTCHGPVETMEEVYQFAPLSMGWCLNCHRTNEVSFAQNNYYEDYHRLHEQLKEGKIDKVTVETIGGTECQKCHY